MKKRPFALRHAAIIFFFVFSLATSVLAQGFARFLTSDTTTQGNWQGKYGVDGYFIGNTSYQSPASYAVFTVQNASGWTWASGTSDPRALAIPSGNEGVASCWYSSSSFAFDVNLTDGNTHQVALYALDWDNWMGGRVETITIVDPSTQAVLDTRTITVFTNGIYLVWNLSGHVQINVTNNNSASNAVISGVLFGAAGSAAPLITSGASTTFTVGAPGTFTVTASGYPSPTFGESGSLPSGVTFNTTTGVLSGTPASGTNGTYPVVFTATNSGGTNSQNFALTVSQAPAGPTASFLGLDTGTQGNWQGKYGVDGYFIGNTSYQSPASYAVFTVQNASGWTWASGTSDPRALAIPSGNEGVASCWYSSSSFAFDVNLTDGNTHQVALYALDWDNSMGGRVETITIVDPSTQAVLDTRTITAFTNGIYLVWNLSGHVQINVTNNNSASNAVISGVLFGTPLIVTTTSLAIGQQGTAYNATLTASGGVSPYSWTLTSGALPAGLSLNSSTGVISGTPTATVNASALAFKVTDSTTPTAQTDITSLTITIVSGAGHSVLLSWDASLSYATSGYNVYRSNISGSSYAKINSAPVPGLSYTDATVASGQTYYYVTTAVDSIGDESGFSNEIQEVVP